MLKPNFFSQSIPLLCLAPMSGLSHAALRCLIQTWGGVDLYFSEMLSSRSVTGGNHYSRSYLIDAPAPGKLVFQLVGSCVEDFVAAAEKLNTMECYGVDINMGCAAPRIRRKGGGITWMEAGEQARLLIGSLRKVLPEKSLSVKIRLGDAEEPDKLVAFCRALEAEGLDFLTLHPRTGKEKFNRRARWEYVGLLKSELRIPVIGSGNISTFADFQGVVERYRPDGVMLGRGAVKKPWLFHHLAAKSARPEHHTRVELPAVWLRFLDFLAEHLLPDYQILRATKFFSYACDLLPCGHYLKPRLSFAGGLAEMAKIIVDYFSRNDIYQFYTED